MYNEPLFTSFRNIGDKWDKQLKEEYGYVSAITHPNRFAWRVGVAMVVVF